MYNLIAIAGTFDRLHKGHRFFISEAFRLSHEVIIGLTSDYYVEGKLKAQSSKLKAKVNNYREREKELSSFLEQEGLLERSQIVRIDDVYGPAIKESQIEALLVTSETLEGARKVNKKRKELVFRPLKILQVPLIIAEDHKRIASTRIRLGEIDRYGKLFISHITYHVSRISEELRQELKKPLGVLIKGNPQNLIEVVPKLKKKINTLQPVMIVTVGDEVTKLCNEIGITINLAIFDYKVGRKEKYHNLEELGFSSVVIPSERSESRDLSRMRVYTISARTSREIPRPDLIGARNDIVVQVDNPPSHITKELVDAVKNAYLGLIKDGKQQIIRVIGEEDLAGVPAILLAPLGSIVLYGQPGEGVVIVEITEDKKNDLIGLITDK